jgi:hypothetical protein
MTKQTRTLASFSPTQLERFLVELVNLQKDLGAIKRFRERYSHFIPPFDQSWLVRFSAEEDENLDPIKGEYIWIFMLKHMLCNLWTEPDFRQKEWGAFALRYILYRYEYDAFVDENPFRILDDPTKSYRIPPPSPFEKALSHLVKSAAVARYCGNPECPAPYFFASRKNQRYCSEICAAPAQRELKRKWWAEHGEEWRAARQEKKSSKREGGKVKAGETPKPRAKTGRKKGQ